MIFSMFKAKKMSFVLFLLVVLEEISLLSAQSEVSKCNIDGFEYIFNPTPGNFDAQFDNCLVLEPEARLASIPNEQSHAFVTNFLRSLGVEIGVFVGIQRLPDDAFPPGADLSDPTLFIQLDRTPQDQNFAQVGGQFPWSSAAPLNGGNQNCVA